jgi:hypothetical protein
MGRQPRGMQRYGRGVRCTATRVEARADETLSSEFI